MIAQRWPLGKLSEHDVSCFPRAPLIGNGIWFPSCILFLGQLLLLSFNVVAVELYGVSSPLVSEAGFLSPSLFLALPLLSFDREFGPLNSDA